MSNVMETLRENEKQCMAAHDDEALSDEFIRCPYCRHVHEVDSEDGLYEEDGREVSCGKCGEDFFVKVMISYTFISPKCEVKP